MDTRIANSARPDIMMIESTARPTPAPSRVSFGQVLAAGVNGMTALHSAVGAVSGSLNDAPHTLKSPFVGG